jgi:hypothetical protein
MRPTSFITINVEGRSRDISEINVAFCCTPVPSKHAVDGLLKLGAARLVDATCVHPKVLQTIAPGLVSTKSDLVVPEFALANAVRQVFEADLFAAPGVRKYRIRRGIAAKGDLGQTDLARVVTFQEAHSSEQI